jgi:hypothetical protein
MSAIASFLREMNWYAFNVGCLRNSKDYEKFNRKLQSFVKV